MPRARCLPSPRCCLPRIRGHSGSPLLFFLLFTRFATSLTFVFRFFYPSFSLQAGVLRRLRRLSTRRPELSSNILVLLLDSVEEPDASTVGAGAKVLSPVDRIPAALLKQALYDSKRTSPRSTRPLPSSWRRSAPYRQGHRQASSIERSTNGCHGTKSLLPRCSITFHQQDGSPTVQRAGPVFASTFRRTPNLRA